MIGKLRGALHASGMQVLLYSRMPEEEELVAAILLLRQYGREPCDIVVATPHPTSRWRQKMREAGANHLWATTTLPVLQTWQPEENNRLDVQTAPCHLLHSVVGDDGVLSVCGACRNHMALALHHFRKWCLADPNPCPYLHASLEGAS